MAAPRKRSAPRQLGWQIDRHIPVALILTVVVQTMSAIWWASAVNSRIGVLEGISASIQPASDRITRLEAKLDSIVEAMAEVKLLLRRPTSPTAGHSVYAGQ